MWETRLLLRWRFPQQLMRQNAPYSVHVPATSSHQSSLLASKEDSRERFIYIHTCIPCPYLLDDRSENASVAVVVDAVGERKVDRVIFTLSHTYQTS